ILHWVQTGRWLATDGPFTIELAESQPDLARLALCLRLKNGLAQAVVLVDRATSLPAPLRRPSVLGEEEWILEKYLPGRGLQLAHQLVHKQGGLVDTYELREAAPSPVKGRSPFEVPQTRPADTNWGDKTATVPLKRTRTGHFFVRPKINGQDLGWCALDTGS